MKKSNSRAVILTMGLLAVLFSFILSGCGGGGGGGGSSPDPSPSPSATVVNYTLTSSVQGEGSLEPPSGSQYESGAVAVLTPIPAQNWVFSQWAGENGDEVENNSITMNSDKSVTAVFVRPTYDLTVNVQGQGSVSQELVIESREEYQNGEKVKLTAVPSVGWVFVRWEGDLEGADNPSVITLDSDKTVTAVFEIATNYILDESWGTGGAVTGFSYPRGLARSSGGELYVTDDNGVKTISANGTTVTDWTYSFSLPISVCVDSVGNIYVVDRTSDSVEIFSAPDVHSSTFGATGLVDPIGVSVDSAGNVYVADFSISTAKKFAPAGGAPTQTWTTDGISAFFLVSNVNIDQYGNLYVSNLNNSVVSVFNSSGTFVEQLPLYEPTLNPYARPVGVVMDQGGFIYVVDGGKDLIVKITPSGTPHAVAEGITSGPQEIAADPEGNLYVADYNNHRVVKLKPAP